MVVSATQRSVCGFTSSCDEPLTDFPIQLQIVTMDTFLHVPFIFPSVLRQGFSSALEPVLKLALVDQAGLELTEICLPV